MRETLPAVHPSPLIEVHMHIFEFLLLFATKQYGAETLQTLDVTLRKKKFQFLHVCLDSRSTQPNGCWTLSARSNPYSSTIALRTHVQSHTDAPMWLPQIWGTELSSVLTSVLWSRKQYCTRPFPSFSSHTTAAGEIALQLCYRFLDRSLWEATRLQTPYQPLPCTMALLFSSSFIASSQALPKLSRTFLIFFILFLFVKCLISFLHLNHCFLSPEGTG